MPRTLASYLSSGQRVSAAANNGFGPETMFAPDPGYTNLYSEYFLFEWMSVGQEKLTVQFRLYSDNSEWGRDSPSFQSPSSQTFKQLSFLAAIDGVWWNGLSPGPKKPLKLGVSMS